MKYIAYLQVIGIVLVVLGHSFHEYPGGNFGMDMLMYRMMHSFRMPLFVFVSGFLMVYTTILRVDASPLPSFVWNKVKRLLLPFVVLSLVTFFPRTLMSGVADDAMTADVATFADALLYNGKLVIPYYWFLQASFLLLVFNYAMISLGRKSGLDDRWVYLLLLVFFLVHVFCSFVSLSGRGCSFFWSIRAGLPCARWSVYVCVYLWQKSWNTGIMDFSTI